MSARARANFLTSGMKVDKLCGAVLRHADAMLVRCCANALRQNCTARESRSVFAVAEVISCPRHRHAPRSNASRSHVRASASKAAHSLASDPTSFVIPQSHHPIFPPDPSKHIPTRYHLHPPSHRRPHQRSLERSCPFCALSGFGRQWDDCPAAPRPYACASKQHAGTAATAHPLTGWRLCSLDDRPRVGMSHRRSCLPSPLQRYLLWSSPRSRRYPARGRMQLESSRAHPLQRPSAEPRWPPWGSWICPTWLALPVLFLRLLFFVST